MRPLPSEPDPQFVRRYWPKLMAQCDAASQPLAQGEPRIPPLTGTIHCDCWGIFHAGYDLGHAKAVTDMDTLWRRHARSKSFLLAAAAISLTLGGIAAGVLIGVSL